MTLIRVQVDFNELNALVDDLTDVVYFSDHAHSIDVQIKNENLRAVPTFSQPPEPLKHYLTDYNFLAQVSEGQRVLLYQDEDDFEVEGVVGRLRIRGRDLWYARPDWATRRDLA